MKKAQIWKWGDWEDITLLSINIVPNIEMERNDLEYSIKQTNKYIVIYLDKHGELDEYEAESLSSIRFKLE